MRVVPDQRKATPNYLFFANSGRVDDSSEKKNKKFLNIFAGFDSHKIKIPASGANAHIFLANIFFLLGNGRQRGFEKKKRKKALAIFFLA